MANYNSQYTGAQIDTAVGKATNPDTTPTANSSKLITSGGVKTAINAETSRALSAEAAIRGLGQATALASGDNLNTVPIGACYCPSAAIGQTLQNCPVQGAFSLLTLNRGPFNIQILIANNDIYTRIQGYRWYIHAGVAVE